MLAAPESPSAVHFATHYVMPWRVLRVECGHELDAELHLSRRGIETFVPTYQAIKRFPDRKPVTQLRGLFPGYAIARWAEVAHALVVSSPRVIDVLSFGRKAAILDEDEMDRLRALGSMEGIEPWQQLADGARIRICSGPLTNTEGTLIRHKGVDSVVVEISMLQRLVRVEVNGYEIEKA